MLYPDHSTCSLPIEDFLLEEKLPWAENPSVVLVSFRVLGERGVYKTVSVGRTHIRPTMVSLMAELQPSKYFILNGIGGLMSELMDMSIMFSLYKVESYQKAFTLEYVVWLKRLEPGQNTNIDADMVEKFSRKICEDD